MSHPFFDSPVLNNPYSCPTRHWQLDGGQPTHRVLDGRRPAEFISPIPVAKKQRAKAAQQTMTFDEGHGLTDATQEYTLQRVIGKLRDELGVWRAVPNPADWKVSPETQTLLQHWRGFDFPGVRPFFCQVEAVEAAIWLTEVAPKLPSTKWLRDHLASATEEANPGLPRLALKLATGAGKTTVMAMLIAWQTLNAVRHPGVKWATRGFLVVTPGLTIKDRLRVLQPNDPDSYFATRDLVPVGVRQEVDKAVIVITNYHAFQLRETADVAKGTRALVEGRTGEPMRTKETEGQMLSRVMSSLMGIKNVAVINDEAHHCYREKPAPDAPKRTGDDRKEAEKNNDHARVWISGLEAVRRVMGISRVFDLSATPFFLSGSGYAEGTLFPWTVCDFSLLDAIECGIVKLPRVPVAENIAGDDLPMYRDLWAHVRADMPKKSRSNSGPLDPLKLPTPLQTALQSLYGHYEKTFKLWQQRGIPVPPCFIIVCQNTAISKLVYDYVSGFDRTGPDGVRRLENGRLPLFRNFDDVTGNPLPRPNTILVDSEQMESDDGLDDAFRGIAADEIHQFRRELIERGRHETARTLTDADLLREVMNTVGKAGQLGANVRCVVSVSMLTEGWDCQTVTHILGLRAFGTQLLCEQVIGRALRRQSYELGEDGLLPVEYADIFGIPFDFTAKPVPSKPTEPVDVITVKAVRPDRDALEIRFPRVDGYRTELPDEVLTATFSPDSTLELNPLLVGPSVTRMAGIIGKEEDFNLDHLEDTRLSTILFHITNHLLYSKFRDPGAEPKLHLFGQLKRIVKQWVEGHLVCRGGTYPAQLIYLQLADMACERINTAITRAHLGTHPIRALLDPYNSTGSTTHVRFSTSKPLRWQTRPDRSHVNWAILDSEWEGEFCRVVEGHPRVHSYVKNQNLGFEVPYLLAGEVRKYRPDFIVLLDDGHGPADLLRLVVETKGYRGEDAKQKKETMDVYWIPGVNRLGSHGRWAFAEFVSQYEIESGFKEKVQEAVDKMIADVAGGG